MELTRGKRLFLLLIPPTLFTIPISLLVFLLDRIASSLTSSNLYRNRYTGAASFQRPDTNTDAIVPIYTYTTPTSAIIGTCVIALGVGVLSWGGIYELRKKQGASRRYERAWAWFVIVCNILGVALCIGVLVWTSVVIGGEDGWTRKEDLRGGNDETFRSGSSRDAQRLTRETWSCSLSGIFGADAGWTGSVCGLSKATRFLLIPLALSLLLTLFSVYILARDRGGVKWLFGGKERYNAFDNIYEMNGDHDPRAGPTPYQPPPMYYPYPQPPPPGMYGQLQPVPYGQPGMYAQPSGPPGPQYSQPGVGAQNVQGVPAAMQPKDPAVEQRGVFR